MEENFASDILHLQSYYGNDAGFLDETKTLKIPNLA